VPFCGWQEWSDAEFQGVLVVFNFQFLDVCRRDEVQGIDINCLQSMNKSFVEDEN
jgi:hypothetical protein